MPFVIIRRALAATARSSLDLLTLQYPFSQVDLLTPEEFVKEAERRHSYAMSSRLHLDVAVLETLHRHGVLVPLFRVDLAAGEHPQPIDVSGSFTARHVTNTIPSELFRAAAEGRVHDPAAEPFIGWPSSPRLMSFPGVSGTMSKHLSAPHPLWHRVSLR